MKKIVAIVLIIVTLLSICSFALAESETYQGTGSATFTVKTGKKNAKLTIENKSGKADGWKWNLFRTKKVDDNSFTCYARYKVTVNGKSYTLGCGQATPVPYQKKVTVNLSKNSTYTICVYYQQSDIASTSNHHFENWVRNPSIKFSVNNGASIW